MSLGESQFNLLARLTDEQADEYARQLIAHGKAAIYDDGRGNVRVLSAEELSPRLRGDESKRSA